VRLSRSARAELFRFLVAAATAAAATYLIWLALPSGLSVRTDIVGFPTFNDFNVDRYFWLYELTWFFPLATLALYALLQWLARRGTPRPPRVPPAVGEHERFATPGRFSVEAAAIARVLFVGAVLGLELSISRSQTSDWIRGVVVPAALFYSALAVGLAFVLARQSGRSFWTLLAALNAAATPLTLLALYGVSAATQVRVAADNTVHHYPFFPLWLALVAAAALGAWLVVSWRRNGLAAARVLERRAIVFVVAPAGLFPFVASLGGALGPMQMFDDGESLAAAQLTRAGAFPWRDLLTIHGPLLDLFRPLIGMELFGDSRWAANAGWFLILIPVAWIAMYALCAYLFRRNWLFLVGSQIAVVTGALFTVPVRFLLLPVMLLLLIALLHQATVTRAAAFALALVVQVVLSPEAGIASVALIATVVCFELYYRDSEHSLSENFRRTILTISSWVVFVAVWFAFLAAFGALGSFIFYFRTFAPGHQLTGGIPINGIWTLMGISHERFLYAAVVPAVLSALVFSFFAVRVRFRLPLRVEDWAIGGATLFMAFYYTKFLARADHIFESFEVTIPVILYVVYRAIELLAARLPMRLRRPGTYALTAVALAVTLALAPVPLRQAARVVPSHFGVAVASEPEMERVGYAVPGAVDPALVSDLGRISTAYLGPKDTIFDFTNSPGLFHYLLRLRPATRYYHVSMAIRQRTQSDLIHELEQRRPKLVFYSSAVFGLENWDGISNPVRHYDVSQYLLDHYRPLLVSHGYLLMGLEGSKLAPPASIRDLIEPPVTSHLYFAVPACNWGDTPNLLTTGPAPTAKSVSVLRAADGQDVVTLSGWAADYSAGKPATEVVAAVGSRVVARFQVSGDRPDVASVFNLPALRHSGFRGSLSLRSASLARLRVYGVTSDGRASELVFGPGTTWRPDAEPPLATLTLPGGRSLQVTTGAIQSSVDAATALAAPLVLNRPTDAGRYHWLEIETRTPLHANSFALSDRANLGNPASSITFNTLDRGARTVRVQIGACSQWRGFRGPLYLSMSRSEEVTSVRVVR
jgi:hypothetical protein